MKTAYLIPATPSTTRSSLVKVPVLSKQQTSTFPAKGIRNGSVQYTPEYKSISKKKLVSESKSEITVVSIAITRLSKN